MSHVDGPGRASQGVVLAGFYAIGFTCMAVCRAADLIVVSLSRCGILSSGVWTREPSSIGRMPRYQRLPEGQGAPKICPLHQGDIPVLPDPIGSGFELVTDHKASEVIGQSTNCRSLIRDHPEITKTCNDLPKMPGREVCSPRSTHVEVVRRVTAAVSVRSSCSPRTWRWSDTGVYLAKLQGVLSTHVEVVRGDRGAFLGLLGALHARGGGPALAERFGYGERCSPRTWRWSELGGLSGDQMLVLSTHVEMVRRVRAGSTSGRSALHACKGGPTWPAVRVRMRRALHTRGGGPGEATVAADAMLCFPRRWR